MTRQGKIGSRGDDSGILPAFTLFFHPSCGSVSLKMFGQTPHDLTLQDSSKAFPVCGNRWPGAGLVGNQHCASLKEQLDLFTEMSCRVMKADKRPFFTGDLSLLGPAASSSCRFDI